MSRFNHEIQAAQTNRGQLSFDLLIAMSACLVAVALVLGFIPVMFEPFNAGGETHMLVADKGAARLTEDLLTESSTNPGVLNATCTVEFFDDDGNTGDCRFETEDLQEALGAHSYRRLNVTIEDNGGVTVLNSTPLAAGPAPAATQDVVTARRLVFLRGTEQTLYVRVW